MTQKTTNIKSILNLKDKTSHISSIVYDGKCNVMKITLMEQDEMLP